MKFAVQILNFRRLVGATNTLWCDYNRNVEEDVAGSPVSTLEGVKRLGK
jgi:hypothetical protein